MAEPFNPTSQTYTQIPPSQTQPAKDEQDRSLTKLPNGVVLDKDGKPCRLCTSAASWRALTKQANKSSSTISSSTQQPQPQSTQQTPSQALQSQSQPSDCPPDVETLGRSTWTLLHSMTASYPERATVAQQTEMRTFLGTFSRLYPCWVCADDFRAWMSKESNRPRLGGRGEFGTWMCEAHNEVNRKLGKEEFDCRFWEERWRTGWKDGRCD